MSKIRDRSRAWWARQPIPFRASATTLLWAFAGTVAAQALRLADDTQTWLFDNGPAPVWKSSGAIAWDAATALLAGLGNLWYRSKRPPVYWPAPTGPAADLAPPAPAP